MTRKVGPLIDLQQKLGDLQVRHESKGFLFELLRLLGDRFLQGTYFKQFARNFCVRQFTLTRESIDLVQLLYECRVQTFRVINLIAFSLGVTLLNQKEILAR